MSLVYFAALAGAPIAAPLLIAAAAATLGLGLVLGQAPSPPPRSGASVDDGGARVARRIRGLLHRRDSERALLPDHRHGRPLLRRARAVPAPRPSPRSRALPLAGRADHGADQHLVPAAHEPGLRQRLRPGRLATGPGHRGVRAGLAAGDLRRLAPAHPALRRAGVDSLPRADPRDLLPRRQRAPQPSGHGAHGRRGDRARPLPRQRRASLAAACRNHGGGCGGRATGCAPGARRVVHGHARASLCPIRPGAPPSGTGSRCSWRREPLPP